MSTNHSHGRGIAVILAITVVWTICLLFTPTKGEAAEPYGGCDEAYSAPKSAAADQCREAGWTIRVRADGHGIIVDPHARVRYVWLPMCRHEDGSGQRSACTWNLGPRKQGNGRGVAYWVDVKDRVHYVWRMQWTGWKTVTSEVADVIAESGLAPHRWERWRYTKRDGHMWLASPAGSYRRLY